MTQAASKPLRDAVRESTEFRQRALIGFLIISCAFAVLLGRFAYLQILKHEEFVTRSEANRLKLNALPPSRGLIFDRNGLVIADNQPAYRLELVPEQVPDIEATLAALQEIINISQDDIERFHRLRKARHSFNSLPLRLRLSDAEVARFAVDRHRFPGVDNVPYQNRVYPQGASLAHLLGYVGRLDVSDLNKVDASQYSATTHIGKTGIERFYERYLHGEVGYERVETNATGRVLEVIEHIPPTSGKNLQLSIDTRLQISAEAALGEYAGAVVAIDPRSGELLAMVSLPTYDPNPFVNGVSSKHYRQLEQSPMRPLFNRALQGGYEPGSTLKPYIGLAGLELGLRTPEQTIFSKGYYQLPGQQRKYHDWKREGHGRVDLVQALGQSVNTYFYELATELGIDRLHSYLSNFGFGVRTGIDLHWESAGILPSREWKRRVHDQPWYPGETVISGIGQGFNVTTPLQLAQAVALLASRGHMTGIHLLREIQDPVTQQVELPEYKQLSVPMADAMNWQTIITGMREVVHGLRGTARAIANDHPAFEIAGKTGTAQVYGLAEDEKYVEEEVAMHLRHHALFIAFAPLDSPRIAVAVVVEHGGGGSRVAAPIARQVIDAWLDLDNGRPLSP